MALVGSSELLKKAQQGRYAIGAFNAENMEMVQAIIDAADEMKSPVIIQTPRGYLLFRLLSRALLLYQLPPPLPCLQSAC